MVEHKKIKKFTKFDAIGVNRMMFSIDVKMSYDTRDPFAVNFSFFEPGSSEIVWIFSRELLRDGLEAEEGEMVGIGDVRLWSARGVKDTTIVKLESPDGYASFKASSEELRGFLKQTQKVVPMNEEGKWYDIDAEIKQLFPGQ